MSGTQEALEGMPLDCGLWKRFVENGAINHGAWLRAIAEREHVGNCPRCGAYLQPEPPAEVTRRTDYTAACLNPACRHLVVAPNGRVGRRRPHPRR